MGLLQAKQIHLSARQKQILFQERNRHQVSGQLRSRIDIILQASNGQSNHHLVKLLHLSYPTIMHWRTHWAEHQPALLAFEKGDGYQPISDSQLRQYMVTLLGDAARSGKPSQLSLGQRQQLQALACSKPSDLGLPLERWSGALLALEAVNRGIVTQISGRYVNMILKKRYPPS